MTSFSTLHLDPRLLKAIEDVGYTDMSPIQEEAIPHVLAGRDVMGSAQTGTGKTAAFSLPLIQRLLKHETASVSPAKHPVRAIVLTPTRELAVQVAESIEQFAKHVQLRSTVVYGGTNIKPQIQKLREGIEIVTATPGRLIDHIQGNTIFLQNVEYVVLDEADRMLDIGFLPDLERILQHLPKQRTTLLFSATFSGPIKKLATSYLKDPVLVEVASPNETAATVEERFLKLNSRDKYDTLKEQFNLLPEKQAFVFLNSKAGCGRLLRMLERDGIKAATIHGDKNQSQREEALAAFKSGDVHLLVATDVAARGLDIKNVPAVFNYDIPYNAEDYVHRIGRTGRAGADGLAISFISEDDGKLVQGIEKLRNVTIQSEAYRPARSGSRDNARGGSSHSGARRDNNRSSGRSGSDRRGGDSNRPRKPRDLQNKSNEFWDKTARSGETVYRPNTKRKNDPIFDQPYQPESDSKPQALEQDKTQVAPARKSKIRKQMAALFKKN